MTTIHVTLPRQYGYIKEVKRNGVIYINDGYEGGETKIISYPSI